MREISDDILLSVQSALTTHISPLLRAVTVDFDKTESMFIVHFFYDGEVTDKLFDLASCATVEMDPGFFEYDMNSDFVTRLDYPAKIPIEGRLVYLRYEPIKTIYPQKSALEYADDSLRPIARLDLAMQDALLGRVTPELRMVTVGIDTTARSIDFYFYYDGEISKLNLDLARSAIKEASGFFPDYSGKEHIIRIDFPKRIRPLGTSSSYHREESYDLID